jgi:hypothetical protein
MDINGTTLNVGIGTTASATARLRIDGGLLYDSARGNQITLTGTLNANNVDADLGNIAGFVFDSARGNALQLNGLLTGDSASFTELNVSGPATFNTAISLADSSSIGNDGTYTFIQGGSGVKINVNTDSAAALFSNDLTGTFYGDINFSSTGYIILPKGTDSERPISPLTGGLRWNTTANQAEIWDSSEWAPVGQGGGYFKGNNGNVGDDVTGPGDIFRINNTNLTANVTIDSDTNASVAGPLTIDSDVTLTVNGTLVIV